LKLGLAS